MDFTNRQVLRSFLEDVDRNANLIEDSDYKLFLPIFVLGICWH